MGKKAVGADGISKADYGQRLEDNLQALVARMKQMSYRPGSAREVLIPKPGKCNQMRPLNIANFEDKIVQKMTNKVLESIYEPHFLDCSYGFRPGRGCHDAIRAVHQHLNQKPVSVVLDIDLANFFGSIDHQQMLAILQKRICDKRFLRYIVRMLKAGVLCETGFRVSEEGVPQGNLASPILSNIFAHEVIDSWFEETVKAHCKGEVALFRYCDDGVICCQHERDAARIKKALSQRLAKYGLTLNEEKTRRVTFSKAAYQQGVKQQAFDFLGFTFYLGRTRHGKVIAKLKTSGKRLREKLKRVNEWCRQVRSRYRLAYIWKQFCLKLSGHIQYYGVSYNFEKVNSFVYKATRILFKWLNRRSQKKSFNWEQFNLFMISHPLPRAKVVHKLF